MNEHRTAKKYQSRDAAMNATRAMDAMEMRWKATSAKLTDLR
jgi:hypothetical protein